MLKSLIRTESHLDLDDIDDLIRFNKIREKLAQRMKQEGYGDASALQNDCFVANFALQILILTR